MQKREHGFRLQADSMSNVVRAHELKVAPPCSCAWSPRSWEAPWELGFTPRPLYTGAGVTCGCCGSCCVRSCYPASRKRHAQKKMPSCKPCPWPVASWDP